MSLGKNKIKLSTKQQIIIEANLLFLKKGFEQTTFADIAKAVGISQPSIYAHFTNKMDLLKGVCLFAAEAGRAYIDSCVPVNERAKIRLKAYLEANLDFFYHQRVQAHSLLALFYFSASSPEILKLFLEIQSQTIVRIENILIQCKYENTYKIKNPFI